MRTEDEMMNLILQVANFDERIKAVLLTGSRASPNAAKDWLQDFDIIYFVADYQRFLNDRNWIDIFGNRMILQLPDEMSFGEKSADAYHYLMLFEDGNRMDLTLYPIENAKAVIGTEEPFVVLLDKKNYLNDISSSTSASFLIQQPSQKDFDDCCNEFWWVCPSVAKGLWRNEVIYAKAMMEGPVRQMFLKIIEWYIGTETAFTVPFGKAGRHTKEHLSTELYQRVFLTYANAEAEDNWTALFKMTDLFSEFAAAVAARLDLHYNVDEEKNVIAFLNRIYKLH